jgi:hypothetical protein
VTIDWRAALRFVTHQPHWQRRVALGGLFMLVMPPVGWMFALGYRSLVGNRFVDGQHPFLPSWRGHFGLIARRGAASSGVILVYLAPFVVMYWLLGVRSWDLLLTHWREIGRFVAAVVIFPPVALPLLPPLYAARYEWLQFSPIEMALLIVLFFAPIAMLPAAFLQVAHHRRFGAAFNVRAAARLIARAPRAYVEGWIVSLAVSAAAVVILPLAPWLLFWSYLSISHVFLQVFAHASANGANIRVLSSEF